MRDIIVIRSCHMMQFMAVCDFLRKQYPDASITAVSQKDVFEDIKNSGFVDNVITIADSAPWNVKAVSLSEKKNLIDKHYDMFVIPYNNHLGFRYDNVEKFVSLVDSSAVMMCMTDGKTSVFTLNQWFLESWRKKILLLGDKLLFLVLGVLLVIVWGVCFLLKPFLIKKEKRITFFSPQNFDYPSARVRCYDFAKILNSSEYTADVIAYDNLLKIRKDYDPIPEEMLDSRKLWVNFVVFLKLLFFNKSNIYVIQKIKYNALAAYLASFIKKTVIVVDMDDDEFSSPVFNFLNAEKFFSFICKTRRVIGIAASMRLKELMLKHVDNVFYIPTVPDIERFYPALESLHNKNEVVFCWSGIVFGPPVFENIEFVLEAFKKLRKHCCNVKLKIAVRGPLLNLLENKIREEYSDIPLDLVEWIAPDKMRDFYTTSDVGLNPLVRDYEFTLCKSPTKLFEYMACGMPSITHRIGESKHIVDDGVDGFLVDDMESFVKKMSLLAEDNTLRSRMGKNAHRKIISKYSLEKVKIDLFEIFSLAEDISKN